MPAPKTSRRNDDLKPERRAAYRDRPVVGALEFAAGTAESKVQSWHDVSRAFVHIDNGQVALAMDSHRMVDRALVALGPDEAVMLADLLKEAALLAALQGS
jgi:hypothetical protein